MSLSDRRAAAPAGRASALSVDRGCAFHHNAFTSQRSPDDAT